MTTKTSDLVIAGAGFAGLALAIALVEALGPEFRVTVADPALRNEQSRDPRASAIAAAARRLFEAIGVWQQVEAQAQPMLDMVVTDSKVDDAVRPTFLTFEGEVQPGEAFAHMIENRLLVDALVAKAKTLGIDLRAAPVSSFSYPSDPHSNPPPERGRNVEGGISRVDVRFADGGEVSARLLVGADGARSQIREQAGIATHGWSYGQSAIVCTVAHERPHNGRAEEHFLPPGPFAILPLTGNRASIVWTERTADAERYVAMSDAEFHDELEKRFGLHLGEISVVGPRRAFPLGLYTARTFIAERIALIGDAAHVIHPIAGQGLNMGLRDVAALAEAVTDAARLGLDIGGAQVLERYQRWRRFDTAMMGVATDGLNRLFSNRSDVLRLARDIGLGVVERMPPLKRMFIREAAGFTGEVPKLLKGEAL